MLRVEIGGKQQLERSLGDVRSILTSMNGISILVRMRRQTKRYWVASGPVMKHSRNSFRVVPLTTVQYTTFLMLHDESGHWKHKTTKGS